MKNKISYLFSFNFFSISLFSLNKKGDLFIYFYFYSWLYITHLYLFSSFLFLNKVVILHKFRFYLFFRDLVIVLMHM